MNGLLLQKDIKGLSLNDLIQWKLLTKCNLDLIVF